MSPIMRLERFGFNEQLLQFIMIIIVFCFKISINHVTQRPRDDTGYRDEFGYKV